MNKFLEQWNNLAFHQEALYHNWAKECGLPEAQFWVLYALCEIDEPLCQNSFCEIWCYSKQTVSSAVANLEKKGLVYLDFAEGSRKKKNLHLTTKGEEFCSEHIRNLQKVEEEALSQLTEQDRNKFFEIYSQLLTILDENASRLLEAIKK